MQKIGNIITKCKEMVKFNSVQNSVEMCKTQKKHRAGRARCECSDMNSPDLSENGHMTGFCIFGRKKPRLSLRGISTVFKSVRVVTFRKRDVHHRRSGRRYQVFPAAGHSCGFLKSFPWFMLLSLCLFCTLYTD